MKAAFLYDKRKTEQTPSFQPYLKVNLVWAAYISHTQLSTFCTLKLGQTK